LVAQAFGLHATFGRTGAAGIFSPDRKDAEFLFFSLLRRKHYNINKCPSQQNKT
jgi:hypothetical protein